MCDCGCDELATELAVERHLCNRLRVAIKKHIEAYMSGADIKPTLAALEVAAGLGQQG